MKNDKYMKWGITLISDALSYNTGEQLDDHLNFLGKQLDNIAEKGYNFNEEDYNKLFRSIDNLNLSTLPNTEKARKLYDD